MHEDPNDVADLLKPTGAPTCFIHRPCTAVARVLYFVWHPVLWLLLLLVACMDMNTYGRTYTRNALAHSRSHTQSWNRPWHKRVHNMVKIRANLTGTE